MNEKSKIEFFSKPDYLNENLKVSFTIEKIVVENLPKITKEELKSKKEQYAIFSGTNEIRGDNSVYINITGVTTISEENQQNRRYYKERVEMVEEINLIEIKKLIEQLESIGEIKPGEIFLGDIHTHPILPSELSGISGAQPSDGDIKEIIDAYENNILNFREPFIFSIAAPDEKGETMYAFYRLVKTKEGYKPKHLDH